MFLTFRIHSPMAIDRLFAPCVYLVSQGLCAITCIHAHMFNTCLHFCFCYVLWLNRCGRIEERESNEVNCLSMSLQLRHFQLKSVVLLFIVSEI